MRLILPFRPSTPSKGKSLLLSASKNRMAFGCGRMTVAVAEAGAGGMDPGDGVGGGERRELCNWGFADLRP